MKRLFSLILLLAILLLTVSCREKIDTSELVCHELDGVKFSLPRYMRRAENEDYDAAFDNMRIFFSVKRITDEMLDTVDVSREDGADAYFNALMSKSGLDKSSVYLERFDHSKLISFRYSYDASRGEGEKDIILYYVILAGEGDNFWYFEICAKEADGIKNISNFETWRNTIILTK